MRTFSNNCKSIKFNNGFCFNYNNLIYICFFQAGIETDQLTVAFETDAASLFCQIDTKDANNSDCIQNNIGKEYSYMVIDLGGRSILSHISQLLVRASTGGLQADFNKHLAIHASASYDFGRTYASVSINGVCWTCTTITTFSLRDLQTYAALHFTQGTHKITM